MMDWRVGYRIPSSHEILSFSPDPRSELNTNLSSKPRSSSAVLHSKARAFKRRVITWSIHEMYHDGWYPITIIGDNLYYSFPIFIPDISRVYRILCSQCSLSFCSGRRQLSRVRSKRHYRGSGANATIGAQNCCAQRIQANGRRARQQSGDESSGQGDIQEGQGAVIFPGGRGTSAAALRGDDSLHSLQQGGHKRAWCLYSWLMTRKCECMLMRCKSEAALLTMYDTKRARTAAYSTDR